MLLRVQDRILLGLAFLEDLFEDLADAGGLMSFSYKQVYGFVPRRYRKGNFYKSVSYALKTKRIEKIVKKDEVYLRLTGQGKRKLVRDFPLVRFQNSHWDGFWRVLPYDIKEIKRYQRDRLRNKLRELDFKQFQKSVYLSPHPFEKEMSDFLETLKLEGKVSILLCQKIQGIDNKQLARKLWRLDQLNQKYKELIENLKKSPNEKDLKEIKAQYLELNSKDPFFPQELLPQHWWREEGRRMLRKA